MEVAEFIITVLKVIAVSILMFTVFDYWFEKRITHRRTRKTVDAFAKELGIKLFWIIGEAVGNDLTGNGILQNVNDRFVELSEESSNLEKRIKKSFSDVRKDIVKALDRADVASEDVAEIGTLLDSFSRKLGYKYTVETKTRRGWEKRK